MSKKPSTIIWEGTIVGYLHEVGRTMFDLWGKWKPLESSVTSDFISKLQKGEQLQIKVGGFDATVEFEPDEYGELMVKMRPQLKE